MTKAQIAVSQLLPNRIHTNLVDRKLVSRKANKDPTEMVEQTQKANF